MSLLDPNRNIIPEKAELLLDRLENSALGWRLFGWLFTISGGVYLVALAVLFLKKPFLANHILPIYWFLVTWITFGGIIFLYFYGRIKKLRPLSLSVPTLLLVKSLRKLKIGLRIIIGFEIVGVVGVLLFAPSALLVTIGGILFIVRSLLIDNDTLTFLENEIVRGLNK